MNPEPEKDEAYIKEEMKKYEQMIEDENMAAMPDEEYLIYKRKWNSINDPGKVKSIQKRRNKNKVAKKSRKANRQKNK